MLWTYCIHTKTLISSVCLHAPLRCNSFISVRACAVSLRKWNNNCLTDFKALSANGKRAANARWFHYKHVFFVALRFLTIFLLLLIKFVYVFVVFQRVMTSFFKYGCFTSNILSSPKKTFSTPTSDVLGLRVSRGQLVGRSVRLSVCRSVGWFSWFPDDTPEKVDGF